MDVIHIFAVLITVSALFSYLNYRYLKWPVTIGLMAIALVFSLIMVGLGELGFTQITHSAERFLLQIDFNETLMHGMLSALLFAGALHVNLEDLAKQKWVVAVLASVGVVTSTFLVGFATYYTLGRLGLEIPFIYALLFGALISPTDPIAVLGILKTANAPKTLSIKIAGESLFNDGVAVVVFLVILGIAVGQGSDAVEVSFVSIMMLFLQEAIGGALMGAVLGYLTYKMLKTVDNYSVEILLTLALVFGGYTLAMSLHLSGPIMVVVAGLLIGNRGRRLAMSDHTREHLDTFWELVDEILNSILFVLIGLELIVIAFTGQAIVAGLIMIPVVLLARFIAVGTPITLMKLKREFSPRTIQVLTWGGLRGGISIALALSIPPSPERETLLVMTYIIVVFSILVQGLTVGKLIKS